MMDAGVPSRRERSVAAKQMASSVQSRMSQWTEDNFCYYEEVMDLIREGSPVQWAKLYHEALKLGIDKTTNINININREQDRADLQALVRTRVTSVLPQSLPAYTPYEEMKAVSGKAPLRQKQEEE